MKQLIYVLLLSAVFIVINLMSCQTAENAIDIFPKDTIDVGSVKVGVKKTVRIQISNQTDQFIGIVSVKGDCNCIVSNASSTGIYPEKDQFLTVTYDSQYDKRISGTIYRNVLVQIDKKPFIQSAKLKINVL